MFCPNCGHELREGACFCGSCGSKVGNAIKTAEQAPSNQQPLTVNDLKNYHEAAKREREFEKSVEQTSEYAALMEDECKRLKSRFTICTVLGAIIAIGFGSAMMSVAGSSSTDIPPSSMLPTIVIACALYFFIPFGCLPIIDFAKKHGFVIWFTVFFLVALFMLVIFFALFAGIPSFISLRSKLKKAKTEADLANEQLSALVA